MNSSYHYIHDEEHKKIYLIDLDGTIYRGNQAISGAKEFINYLKQNNRKFLFVTNCPLNSIEALTKKLISMGIECNENDFINSSMSTCDFLKTYYKDKKVFLIGSEALQNMLISNDIKLTHDNADIVVVGYDNTVNYEKLKNACIQINKGAKLIATNPDNNIPYKDTFIPHTGAMISFIENACGVKATIIGKPNQYLLHTACKQLKCKKSELCVIGDRIDTDISFAINNGIDGYLVLTGAIKSKDETFIPKPTKIFNNLKEIIIFERRLK